MRLPTGKSYCIKRMFLPCPGEYNSGIYNHFEYDKKADKFQSYAKEVLTAVYDTKSDQRTKMSAKEIEKEFISRKKTKA